MSDAPITRPRLLLRVRDANDNAAWTEFVEIYTPLIYRYCRQHGLQDAASADVAQESMRAVARSIAKFEYDPHRGKFRNWLLTVVQNKMRNFLAGQERQPSLAGESTLELKLDHNAVPAEDSKWETEYYRQLFKWGTDRIRTEFQETTWQAFWRTTVDECDGKIVAEALGLSVGAVYVAKSRVIARLKEVILSVDAEGGMPPEFFL